MWCGNGMGRGALTSAKLENFGLKVCPRGPREVRHPLRSRGTNFETKICFGGFKGPLPIQNELYHTPLLSKIWDLGVEKFMWDDPFKVWNLQSIEVKIAKQVPLVQFLF